MASHVRNQTDAGRRRAAIIVVGAAVSICACRSGNEKAPEIDLKAAVSKVRDPRYEQNTRSLHWRGAARLAEGYSVENVVVELSSGRIERRADAKLTVDYGTPWFVYWSCEFEKIYWSPNPYTLVATVTIKTPNGELVEAQTPNIQYEVER